MKTPQRTQRMRTPIRTKVVEVHFCEICGRRIANLELITTGTKLCSDCDKLTSIRRPSSRRSSRRRALRYEKHFWLVMGLVALTFVLLVAAILVPAKSSRVTAVELNAVAQIPASAAAQLRPETPKPVAAASTAKLEHTINPAPSPTKRRNPDAPDAPSPTPTPTTPPTAPTPAPKPATATKDHAEPSVTDLLNTSQTAKKTTSDDVTTADNKQAQPQPAPATPPATPAPAAPAAPKTAASAASTAPAVQPAPAAEASKAAEEFEPFDVARKKAYARIREGDAFAARRIFEQQRKNPALENAATVIDDELALIDDVERVQKALAAGFKQLDSRKFTTLRLNDGHSVNLSDKCRITAVKDDALEIEEKAEGASLTRKLSFSQLTPQTRYDVAAQGLSAGPSASLSLAATAYVFMRTGTGSIPFAEFKTRIEAARKDGSLAQRAEHLLELYTSVQKQQALETAMKKINEAIKGKLPGLARNLLRDFKKDFATGDVPANVQEFIDKATFELAEVKQGLWASFFSGTEENPMQKYIFSREETKLNFAWGQGSPDPRVPNDCFGIRFHGLLRITTPGTYVFWASADDMLELTIDGQHVVAANWVPDAEGGKTGSIKLTTGDHDLKVTFKELFVDALMHVKWRLDADKTFQEIPENALWYDPKLVERYQKDVN